MTVRTSVLWKILMQLVKQWPEIVENYPAIVLYFSFGIRAYFDTEIISISVETFLSVLVEKKEYFSCFLGGKKE